MYYEYKSFLLGDHRMFRKVQSIMLIIKGKSPKEVASIAQVSSESIRRWVKDFLLKRMKCFVFKKSPGRPRKLSKTMRRQLADILENSPEEQGYLTACWTCTLIQDLIKNKFGILYNPRYIAQMLKNMGFSYQKASTISDKQDYALREHWISKFLPRIINYAKKEGAHLLFEDESFFQQWGSLSYSWSKVGCQPLVYSSGNRRSYKTFGAIDFWTGRFVYQCEENSLNTETYISFLQKLMREFDGKIIVIQDNAGYHRSKDLKDFVLLNSERIKLYQLPPYSPDFNPIEKLWKKVKRAGTHMKHFPTYEHLKACVDYILAEFANKPEEILSLFTSLKERAPTRSIVIS